MEWIINAHALSEIELLKEAGCDAVVFYDDDFSVCSIYKVDILTILKAKKICEDLNINLYISMNRMVFEEDLQALEEKMKVYFEIGVDGIYFADMALFMIAKKYRMLDKMMFQPVSVMTNSFDGNSLINKGIKRVCLSDEITLDEILMIAKKTSQPVEVKVYGRMVLSYSKRPLLSNYKEEVKLDKNLKYLKNLTLMEETRDHKMPIYEDQFGTYIFSADTICVLDELKTLQEHSILFRLEGVFDDITQRVGVLKYMKEALKTNQGSWTDLDDSYMYSTGYFYNKTNLVK